MTCINCKDDYGPEFDEDFIDGECLPCRVQREMEEEEAKENQQLQRWNKKFNQNLSMDDFWNECPNGIKREELKGFPLLRGIWEWVRDDQESYEAECKFWEERKRQPTLFDESGDLPF